MIGEGDIVPYAGTVQIRLLVACAGADGEVGGDWTAVVVVGHSGGVDAAGEFA